MIRRFAILTAIVAAIGVGPSLHAYLKLGYELNGRLVGLAWTKPVGYFVTNRNVTGVTAAQLQTAVAGALGVWSAPSNIQLSSQFLGFTGIDPDVDDGLTVIGFRSRPELDRTLGATSFEFDSVTGEFLGADIFMNSIFEWSVAPSGDATRFDVASVMTHEIGHLLGLGHSALGETEPRPGGGRVVLGKRAVMFPIAYPRGSVLDRALQADDVAGITDIYGDSESSRELGAISGRVTLNGAGVFGAHITAFNSVSGEMVSGFSLNNQGEFVIASLAPGVYIVRVEPVDDADIDGFFDEDFPPNLNFRVTYYTKQVAVPKGGTSGDIEIKVRAK
jgi:Matrixin